MFFLRRRNTKNGIKIAKFLVHTGNYAIGKHRFAIKASITNQEAKTYLELYHKTYPSKRLKKLFEEVLQKKLA